MDERLQMTEEGEQNPAEAVLVRRAQRGDITAVAELYRRTYPVVLGYLRRRCQDEWLAEDLASETFIRALSALRHYVHRRPFAAWLTVIARNLHRDYVTSVGNRLCAARGTAAQFADVPDATNDPELTAMANLQRAELRRRIEGLEPAQRTCVQLRFFVGLDVEQTAEVLHRTSGATKALQLRAIQRLRRDFGLVPQRCSTSSSERVQVAAPRRGMLGRAPSRRHTPR